eukprot:9584206-Alexandrium_andersonii.AAC.1
MLAESTQLGSSRCAGRVTVAATRLLGEGGPPPWSSAAAPESSGGALGSSGDLPGAPRISQELHWLQERQSVAGSSGSSG